MFWESLLLQKLLLIKAPTSTCSIAWYGKGQGNTEEWSGLGGRKGAVGSRQEGLNFLFIAAMKLWAGRQAGRQADKEWPLKSQEICYFFEAFNLSCQPFAAAAAAGYLPRKQLGYFLQQRTAQGWYLAPEKPFPLEKQNKKKFFKKITSLQLCITRVTKW